MDAPALPPKSYAELKKMIAQRQISFTDGGRKVIGAALENPELIAFGTAASIASSCEVAPSTVVRVFQALGFASLRDFKRIFQGQLISRQIG